MKETETLELKKSLAQLKEGVISLSAMLNKHNKGELYFGINDDGVVYNVDLGKKTLSDITHEIQNNLKPLPAKVYVNNIIEDGKNIIKIVVEGDDTPYCAYGRYYIRINDSDILMESNQLQQFFENKKDNYSKWELSETKYGVDDIDEELLIDCIRVANDNGRINYVYRNASEALSKLGLLTDNNHLNNAGLYLFGKNKPLIIKEANYPTDSRTEFGEIKEFRGNIIECIREAINYIQNHISYKSQIIGYQREEKPEIPVRALREIIINAFAHASYAVEGDYINFIIYKSSIQIYNPGPIIRGIDPISFASGRVGSKIRNLLIASTLFKYGYIDAFGTGFDRTFTLCSNDGVICDYDNNEFGFKFIFKRKGDYLNNKLSDNISEFKRCNLDDDILKVIKGNKYITIPELSNILHKSEPTIHRHLDKLVERGMVERVGSRKTGYWKIIKY